MDPGQGQTGWRKPLSLGLILVLLAGCAGGGNKVDRALLSQRSSAHPSYPVANYYQIHCPDQVDIHFNGIHPWQGQAGVGPDGRMAVGTLGVVRVDGLTPPQVGERLGQQLGLRPDQVQVTVTAYKSQQIYLYGEVAGSQRAVEYQGPETVVELLQRVGGLTPGASPCDVQVVRAHVADGKQPEIFHVDLNAIVLKRDEQSNIRVQPFDQIYIGQTKQSCLAKCLPPVFRTFFEYLCGLKGQADNKVPAGDMRLVQP